jgi:hypothetical protein
LLLSSKVSTISNTWFEELRYLKGQLYKHPNVSNIREHLNMKALLYHLKDMKDMRLANRWDFSIRGTLFVVFRNGRSSKNCQSPE